MPTPESWKYRVWYTSCKGENSPAAQLECANFNLEDWPRLSRYAEANKCLPAGKKNEKRVVFMGDSITDGWSKVDMGGFFPGKPYINRGIGGQTTAHMLVRFRQDVIALQPKVIVMLAGTNDIGGNAGPASIDEIENNLASMAELAKANGIKVVLASVLPVTAAILDSNGKPKFSPSERRIRMIVQLNEWIAAYAKKQRHVYLDYFTALVDPTGALKVEDTNDGLHPNAAGYAVMAPLAEKAIAKALRK